MGLVEEARNATLRPGPKCGLNDELARHPDLADEIRAVISDRSLSAPTAARVFMRSDIHIREFTIKRHRANLCVTCQDHGVTW